MPPDSVVTAGPEQLAPVDSVFQVIDFAWQGICACADTANSAGISSPVQRINRQAVEKAEAKVRAAGEVDDM